MLDHDRRSHAQHPRLLPPPPPLGLPEAARARHARRALEQAAEHGIALLQALGLPRLVTADFEPVDLAEVGNAVDRAIAVLDEADAPGEDLEDEAHDEPALGWLQRDEQAHLADGFGEDEDTLGWGAGVSQLALGPNTEDGEHTLGAPERHPYVASMTAPWFEPATGGRARRDGAGHSQASWAQGERQDGEGEAEAGYDLPEGDDERCASGDVDAEPSLGSLDHEDQTGWATHGFDGGSDRELDPLDDIARTPGAGPHVSRSDLFALEQRAKALRRRLRFGITTPPAQRGNLVPVDTLVLRAVWPMIGGHAHG